jgi:hypothetical protein
MLQELDYLLDSVMELLEFMTQQLRISPIDLNPYLKIR